MKATLTFCGGAGTVTGACYLLDTGEKKMLVDCGLFQGSRFAEAANHEPFPFAPSQVSTVCVTHAHADHIGRLPKLYRDGFRGTIISTPATADLAAVMLEDAYKIMCHECDDSDTHTLYSKKDLEGVLALFAPRQYNERIDLSPSIAITLRDSAHILGSAMIEMHVDDEIIVFTGDLGNTPAPLLKSIYPLQFADYLCMESVYGDRLHESTEDKELLLERAIEDIYSKKGTLIIPVFALERTQALLATMNWLVEENRIPKVPIYLDSPLAINATSVYRKYSHELNRDMQSILGADHDLFSFPGLEATRSSEESKHINTVPPPKIILAGNPHGYGSRIAYHLERALPDPNSTVLFVGYARVSSIGRQLMDGAREIRLHGRSVPVRASIQNISGYSAHADQAQLKSFVAAINKPIRRIFVTMGEERSSRALANILADEVGVSAEVPNLGDTITLE
ncbi:MBL fold metallo-hydrolase [Candidatus Uhrbacteria bacterium]|nr:MBL fold metallo-hydrolase [Candidatus Uhrbacteria bacterium]